MYQTEDKEKKAAAAQNQVGVLRIAWLVVCKACAPFSLLLSHNDLISARFISEIRSCFCINISQRTHTTQLMVADESAKLVQGRRAKDMDAAESRDAANLGAFAWQKQRYRDRMQYIHQGKTLLTVCVILMGAFTLNKHTVLTPLLFLLTN